MNENSTKRLSLNLISEKMALSQTRKNKMNINDKLNKYPYKSALLVGIITNLLAIPVLYPIKDWQGFILWSPIIYVIIFLIAWLFQMSEKGKLIK